MSLSSIYSAKVVEMLEKRDYELRQRQKVVLEEGRRHTIERGREYFLNNQKQLLISRLCGLVESFES
ncbi:MAG: hypothetical protein ABIE22_05270 [archaeon]